MDNTACRHLSTIRLLALALEERDISSHGVRLGCAVNGQGQLIVVPNDELYRTYFNTLDILSLLNIGAAISRLEIKTLIREAVALEAKLLELPLGVYHDVLLHKDGEVVSISPDREVPLELNSIASMEGFNLCNATLRDLTIFENLNYLRVEKGLCESPELEVSGSVVIFKIDKERHYALVIDEEGIVKKSTTRDNLTLPLKSVVI